jgi:enterobacteria phage integrase
VPARRNHARRDWPRGLYENPPGYFRWRHPTTGEMHTLGRIPFDHARNQAIEANAWVWQSRSSLVDKLRGSEKTLQDLLDAVPISAGVNSGKSQRALNKIIAAELGAGTQLSQLDVRACSDALERIKASGRERTAQAIRSRMSVLFKKAQAKGWMLHNPAAVTERPEVEVRRARLTLEQYLSIRACAVPWLAQAMDLLLITQQDRDTVCGMRHDMVRAITPPGSEVEREYLVVQRAKTAKTNQPVAIPLDLRLAAVGLTLREVIARRWGVRSEYLVHHIDPHTGANPGDPVFRDTVSKDFTAARKRAGIPDALPNGQLAPTYYEIKSLSKRLYKTQGDVDTRLLASHTDKSDRLYADPRGIEPVFVK